MHGYEFESCWSHLNFRYCTYFEEEVAEFLDIQATVEYRFTQKCSCEMIRTHKVQSFTFWVMGKASPHLPKFAHSLPPGKIPHLVDSPPPQIAPPPPPKKKNTHTKSQSPHTHQITFSRYSPIKTSFLVVVIAPVPFLC